VATAVVGLAVADAAQLNVSGTGLVVGSESRCTNGPIATTPATLVTWTTFSAVSLAGLTGCDGLAVQITVFGSTGNSIVTGSGTAGADPLVISTGNYDAATVTGVALLVGTWGVPATWTSPACTTTSISLAPGSPVGASGKYRAVTLSSVDSNCVGGTVVVLLYNSSGTLLHTGSGTVPSGASFTLPNEDQYVPSQVVATTISLTIDGYTIPYTWTP
jgi:hypothetical protein